MIPKIEKNDCGQGILIAIELEKALRLTKNELIYLRMLPFNVDENTMMNRLFVNEGQFFFWKARLKQKFYRESTIDIILKGFEDGYLRKSDYVDKKIKEFSHNTASSLCSGDLIAIAELNVFLKKFLKSCNLILKNKITKSLKGNLSPLEIELVKSIYYKEGRKLFIRRNNISKRKYRKTLKRLYKKMNSKNTFNLIKHSHVLGIIPENTFYEKSIKKLTREYVHKIRKIKKSSDIDELKVYRLWVVLIDFFATTELAILNNVSALRDDKKTVAEEKRDYSIPLQYTG